MYKGIHCSLFLFHIRLWKLTKWHLFFSLLLSISSLWWKWTIQGLCHRGFNPFLSINMTIYWASQHVGLLCLHTEPLICWSCLRSSICRRFLLLFNPVYLRRLDSMFDIVSNVTFFSQISLIWLVKRPPMKSSHEIVKVLKYLSYF